MDCFKILGKKQEKISLKSAILAVVNLEIPDWKIFKKNEELRKRVNSVWSPAETAVANGLSQKGRLSEGQLIKVAILQPYKPKSMGR